jgi:phosphatidylglycerol lysyltransferase
VTFWLGLLALGGLSLVFSPLLADVPFPGTVTMVGVALLSVSIAYVVAAAVRRRPISVRGFQLPLPSGRLALLQLLLSSLDWALAGAVLYVLLPRGAAPFPVVVSAFVAAQILGLAAHVPGGVGIFEGVIVLLLKPYMTSVQLAPALVAYRVIYYLAPLSIALIVLAGAEISERRHHAARLTRAIARVAQRLTPRILATLTFVAGVVLLFSGATPAAAHRLALPRSIRSTRRDRDLAHPGQCRRRAAAAPVAGAVETAGRGVLPDHCGISAGIVASLLKGVDYEEAIVLGLLLVMLRRARPMFDRKAGAVCHALFTGVDGGSGRRLAASVWLGLFAFSTSSSPLICGGSSRCTARRRDSCAARWPHRLSSCSWPSLVSSATRRMKSSRPSDRDLADAGEIIAHQPASYPT